MRVDCFNVNEITPTVLLQIKNIVPNLQWVNAIDDHQQPLQQALSIAQQYTARSNVLTLSSSTGDCISELCLAIAIASERIAAIIINQHEVYPYYARKVRELASAEGALMIWDISQHALELTDIKISKKNQPDLLCFRLQQYPTVAWIAGRER